MARDLDRVPAYNWQFVFVPGDRAICTQTDPYLWTSEDTNEQHVAARMCRNCPLIDECLLEGLINAAVGGVWGGKTPKALSRMRRDRDLIRRLRATVEWTATNRAFEETA